MKILYFDCAGGISGNMILGALLDLGIPITKFRNELLKINVSGWKLQRQRITHNGINTTKIDFIIKNKKHRTSLEEIINVIRKSSLKKQIKKRAQDIFHSIGVAESRIHNQTVNPVRKFGRSFELLPNCSSFNSVLKDGAFSNGANKIHLHELGGKDTILDVVGTLILLDMLKIDRIYGSELPLGRGTVRCVHGLLPLPAPATVELLKGIPVYGVRTNKELVTPTGAAIIRNIAHSFGPLPKMKIIKIGYGSGSYKIKNLPSLLRVFLGDVHNG